MLAAVNPEGVIGIDNRIPWHYPEDLKRFKRLTTGHTVIMGRRTFESIGRPLPRRKNIVVTRHDLDGVECVRTLPEALTRVEGTGWFIGGRAIYEEAMAFADGIDLTLVPDRVEGPGRVFFPPIDPKVFEAGPVVPFPDDPNLSHQVYRRFSNRD